MSQIPFLETINTDGDDFVEFYDELPLWSAPFGLQLLERVPLGPRMTYVDIGAGTGFLALELAERCGPGANIIAVDPWKGAMDRLKRKIKQRGLKNIKLLVQKAEAMVISSDSVDVIVSNLGINNFEDPASVAGNCMQILKKGGRLFLTTNLLGHMAEFYSVFCDTLKSLNQEDRLSALEAHITHRSTCESASELLTRAGFVIDEVVSSSFRMRFADGSSFLRHSFIRMAFLPAWIAIPRPDLLIDTFIALEENLNMLASRTNELTLTVPIAYISATKPVTSNMSE